MSRHIVHDSSGSWYQCPECKGTGLVDYYAKVNGPAVKVKCSCRSGRRYIAAHEGECVCDYCGQTNRFRSDFTYRPGQCVMHQWCNGCEMFRDQRVTRTDNVKEVTA